MKKVIIILVIIIAGSMLFAVEPINDDAPTLLDTPVVTITYYDYVGQVSLSWDSVDQAESYKILKSDNAYGPFSVINQIPGLLYFDTILGDKKFYQVIASTEEVVQ